MRPDNACMLDGALPAGVSALLKFSPREQRRRGFMLRLFAAVVLGLMLVGCGGGGDTALPQKAMFAQEAIQALPQYRYKLMVKTGAAQQVTEAGDIGVILPYHDVAGVTQILADNPQASWVYVADEMFWTGENIQVGWREDEITAAAREVKAAGKFTTVTIIPEIVLSPGFALKDMQAFDAIGLDIYPSLGLGFDAGGCTYNDNPYTTLLWCAGKHLLELGYTGVLCYVYQAFGTTDDPQLIEKLELQRQTMIDLKAMGGDCLVGWGYDIDPTLYAPLIPGEGSDFDALVRQ